MKHFYLLDEDPRYRLLGDMLWDAGYRVSFSLEKEEEAAFYFFSLGAGEEKIRPVLEDAKKGSFAFIGKNIPTLSPLAKEKNIVLCPALEDEIYLLKNAKATAEGVLKHVIESCPRTLSELTVLVYGFGNCGSEIARLLWLCGCEVFITSRERGSRAATKEGFNVFPAEKKGLSMFDAVINTVPDPIFSPSLLETLGAGSHFFQVASGLSGIDPDSLSSRGVLFHPLPRLPGRYAPLSEAQALYDLISRTMETNRSKQ